MSPAAQRYEVAQIFAEAQAFGVPLGLACIAAAQWFETQGIEPPKDLLAWLGRVPMNEWRPDRTH